MSIVQVGLISVIGVLLAIQFQNDKKEYATYISVAIGLLIFVCIVNRLEIILGMIREIIGYITIDITYFATLFKMLGVTYVAEFAAAICKDTGHQTLASQIEVFGKLTILALALPILLALLKTIADFLA